MPGLLGLVESLGSIVLRPLIGKRADIDAARAFLLRMVTGGTLVGTVVGLITYPFAPASHSTLLGEVEQTFGDWILVALAMGMGGGLVLTVVGLWIEGKDITKL